VLARYKSFNSTILLRDLAYEIALSVREAQVYGISVHGASGLFNYAYGVHFTPGTTYTLFADINDNKQYDPNGAETVSSYAIGQRNQITSTTDCPLTTPLVVLFKRPEPDARFYRNDSALAASSVCVSVSAPDGNTRTVRIWQTGQISIE